MPPKLWVCVPETTLNFFLPLMLYDHYYSSILSLVVVASTQQIASAMCVANSLQKALSGELYLGKRSVSCIVWHASRCPR